MIEDHIDLKDLLTKIKLLFDYRMFPYLLTLDDKVNEETVQNFRDKLISLQVAIYLLDAHLESNWEVNHQKLSWYWTNIHEKLELFGIEKGKHGEYINHIRKYEKHELEIRNGKTPLRFEMEYFYFYKSCDVKLLRRLIYEKFDISKVAGSLSDWRCYDLVTEVNDDIEDIYEDLDFINGNRFLLSIQFVGKEKTYQQFSDFLTTIEDKANSRYLLNPKADFDKWLLQLTLSRIAETKELLEKTINKLDMDIIQNSKLLHFQMSLKNE